MSRRRGNDLGIDGILYIDKPAAWTSFDVVARVRRLTGIQRVGHGGTLDPAATGLLPVAVGRATRALEYLQHSTKVYEARVMLGVTTDTYDADGVTTSQVETFSIAKAEVEQALATFRGVIRQTPPMYSALKHKGTPLYEYARAGEEIERESRNVTIYRAELVSFQQPHLELVIECSHGTYIRSIAHDLGQLLGCGAHLTRLVRTQVGTMNVSEAISLPEFEQAVARGDWTSLLYATDSVLEAWKAAIVTSEHANELRTGRSIRLASTAPGVSECRAFDPRGTFIGVLRREVDSGAWRPDKVFPVNAEQEW